MFRTGLSSFRERGWWLCLGFVSPAWLEMRPGRYTSARAEAARHASVAETSATAKRPPEERRIASAGATGRGGPRDPNEAGAEREGGSE